MEIIGFEFYKDFLIYTILVISAIALFKIFILILEKKFKKKKKEKDIYNHIKMVDEQKEKYKRDKEQKIKEENLRRKKEFYEKEIRKI